jgi:DNA-directed RNA polymerase specialized sigma24 family protein
VLDRPLGTIKSDLFRALRKLRPLLDEQEVS